MTNGNLFGRALRCAGLLAIGLSATACMFLGALWVRSYWADDAVYGWFGFPGYLQINSNSGCLKVIANEERQRWGWNYEVHPPNSLDPRWDYSLKVHPRFGRWLDLRVPHGVMVSAFAIVIPAAWLSRGKRFRLSTLLIVTTVAALLLGLVASGI